MRDDAKPSEVKKNLNDVENVDSSHKDEKHNLVNKDTNDKNPNNKFEDQINDGVVSSGSSKVINGSSKQVPNSTSDKPPIINTSNTNVYNDYIPKAAVGRLFQNATANKDNDTVKNSNTDFKDNANTASINDANNNFENIANTDKSNPDNIIDKFDLNEPTASKEEENENKSNFESVDLGYDFSLFTSAKKKNEPMPPKAVSNDLKTPSPSENNKTSSKLATPKETKKFIKLSEEEIIKPLDAYSIKKPEKANKNIVNDESYNIKTSNPSEIAKKIEPTVKQNEDKIIVATEEVKNAFKAKPQKSEPKHSNAPILYNDDISVNEDDEEFFRKASSTMGKIIMIVIIVIFLAIAAVLVYSLNLKQTENNTLTDENASLQSSVDELQSQNTALQSQVDDLTTQLDSAKTLPPTETSSPTKNTNTDNSTSTLPTTYTVKSGDSLSKISQKFYGNKEDYQKIADASGIDPNSALYVGEVLEIPE